MLVLLDTRTNREVVKGLPINNLIEIRKNYIRKYKNNFSLYETQGLNPQLDIENYIKIMYKNNSNKYVNVLIK